MQSVMDSSSYLSGVGGTSAQYTLPTATFGTNGSGLCSPPSTSLGGVLSAGQSGASDGSLAGLLGQILNHVLDFALAVLQDVLGSPAALEKSSMSNAQIQLPAADAESSSSQESGSSLLEQLTKSLTDGVEGFASGIFSGGMALGGGLAGAAKALLGFL